METFYPVYQASSHNSFYYFLQYFKLSVVEDYKNIEWKQETDSLETRAVLTEIFMLWWNLPSGPKHWGWLQKNIAFLEGNSSLQVISYYSGWSKRWYGSIYKEIELQMDCLTSRRLFLQKVYSYKCQFCTNNVRASSSLQGSTWGWSLKFIWWLGKI